MDAAAHLSILLLKEVANRVARQIDCQHLHATVLVSKRKYISQHEQVDCWATTLLHGCSNNDRSGLSCNIKMVQLMGLAVLEA